MRGEVLGGVVADVEGGGAVGGEEVGGGAADAEGRVCAWGGCCVSVGGESVGRELVAEVGGGRECVVVVNVDVPVTMTTLPCIRLSNMQYQYAAWTKTYRRRWGTPVLAMDSTTYGPAIPSATRGICGMPFCMPGEVGGCCSSFA